jgi:Recombination endonuclease VII
MVYRSTHDHDEGDLETGTRICTRCEARKAMTEFNKTHRGQYRLRVCKHCVQAGVRGKRPCPSASQRCDRKWSMKTRYGLREDQFLELLVARSFCCKICDTKLIQRKTRVDHDQATGAVRGLLCHDCNIGLGFFRDNAAALRQAAAYIDRASRDAEFDTWQDELMKELASYGLNAEDNAR